ncbi:MAG: PTS sugar transporter subunit IIA [Planctomycetota bacterium]|nr:MAG: PTS sugar transporter subunit IIA [Planctomycetota bacterium]
MELRWFLEIFQQERICIFPPPPLDKEEMIRRLVEVLKSTQQITEEEEVLQAVLERERCMTTGIGGGLAIPHGKSVFVDSLAAALGVVPEGMDFEAMDQRPVFVVALIVSHPTQPHLHLRVISEISKRFRLPELQQSLIRSQTPSEVFRSLKEALSQS